MNIEFPNDIYEMIYSHEEDRYDFNLADEKLNTELIPEIDSGRTTIIADERFTFNLVDWKIVEERLYRLLPGSRILFIIRNQYDIIRSFYDMHPYSYFEGKKLLQPNEWLASQVKNLERSFLGALFYDQVINKYNRDFGPENVEIIEFEQLVGQDIKTYNELAEFLNITSSDIKAYLSSKPGENASTQYLYHLKLKYFPNFQISRFIPAKFIKKIMRLFPFHRKTIWTENERKIISDLYRSSNNNLKSLHKSLSLDKYPL